MRVACEAREPNAVWRRGFGGNAQRQLRKRRGSSRAQQAPRSLRHRIAPQSSHTPFPLPPFTFPLSFRPGSTVKCRGTTESPRRGAERSARAAEKRGGWGPRRGEAGRGRRDRHDKPGGGRGDARAEKGEGKKRRRKGGARERRGGSARRNSGARRGSFQSPGDQRSPLRLVLTTSSPPPDPSSSSPPAPPARGVRRPVSQSKGQTELGERGRRRFGGGERVRGAGAEKAKAGLRSNERSHERRRHRAGRKQRTEEESEGLRHAPPGDDVRGGHGRSGAAAGQVEGAGDGRRARYVATGGGEDERKREAGGKGAAGVGGAGPGDLRRATTPGADETLQFEQERMRHAASDPITRTRSKRSD